MSMRLVDRCRHVSAVVCSLVAGSCFAAEAAGDGAGFYIGVFGGVGESAAMDLRQRGAVLLNSPHAFPRLPIDADGATGKSNDIRVSGGHVGYEWAGRNLGHGWRLKPAAELEVVYVGSYSPVGEMPVTPAALGTQYVTIPMSAGLVLANAVFTFQTPYSNKVSPYLGVGVGVAFVSIDGSDSANPSEPGINHFNSDPDASDTAFALQFKAGIRSEVHRNLYLFIEYRHVYIDATRYKFGATDYPGVHLPTVAWDVDLGSQRYDLFVVGLQYRF